MLVKPNASLPQGTGRVYFGESLRLIQTCCVKCGPPVKICCFRHGELYPPLYGALIRAAQFLRALARNGHEVTLYTYGDEDRIVKVDGITWHSIARRPRFLPNLASRIYGGIEARWAVHLMLAGGPRLALHALRSILTCDLVYVEHIWSALPPALLGRVIGKPVVVDDHNVELVLAERSAAHTVTPLQRFAATIWRTYVRLLESLVCKLATLVIVTSKVDRLMLHTSYGIELKKIKVVTNGVDLEEYRPAVTPPREIRKVLKLGDAYPVVVFVGHLEYPPNLYAAVWIVQKLAPPILGRWPTARIILVGKLPSISHENPHLYLDPRIVFTGQVKDAAQYINAADVCLAPMEVGSGTRMKILSYIACGKPVITTRVGAEGLDLRNGKEVVMCSLEEISYWISRILDDTALAKRLSENGLALSREYDWTLKASELNLILEQHARKYGIKERQSNQDPARESLKKWPATVVKDPGSMSIDV